MLFQENARSAQTSSATTNNATACPNCWGYSRWESQDCPAFFDIDKGPQGEVNSRNGFIRRFVKKFVG